jgi:hypothetical protein
MKKKLFHLLIPLLAFSSAMRADEQHALIISFHESDSVAVVLADKPRVTFVGDSLLVETADFSATYLRSSIVNFHFGWFDPTISSIDTKLENKNMVRIVYTDHCTVRLLGVDATSLIQVYALDGRRMGVSLLPLSEGVAIDLAAYPTGIYLINVNNQQTFKIIKS